MELEEGDSSRMTARRVRKATASTAIKQAVMSWSRGKKTAQFTSLCQPGSSILDVGVSGQVIPDQPLNHLLENFDRDPKLYTGLGVDDMSALSAAHPGMRFVRYDGVIMPFTDKEFDWVYCNAVIEHVGDDAAQLRLVTEMLRVARNVFFTTPNRYFPIETHSTTAFMHWHRGLFDSWAKRRNKLWLSAEQLRLLSRRDLVSLLNRSGAKYEIRANRFCGIPMTFSVIARS